MATLLSHLPCSRSEGPKDGKNAELLASRGAGSKAWKGRGKELACHKQ